MKRDNEKRLIKMAGCRHNIKNNRNRSLNYINVAGLFCFQFTKNTLFS